MDQEQNKLNMKVSGKSILVLFSIIIVGVLIRLFLNEKLSDGFMLVGIIIWGYIYLKTPLIK